MDVLVERVAGMDISKRDAKVCVRTPGPRAGQYVNRVNTYGSTLGEVERLRRDLEQANVDLVVMEATGDYWKPFFFVLAETLRVELVNATAARNLPGRKTDVSDATWLAQLAAHGLLRASFIPPEPIRELRDLTRLRAHLTQERSREWARLEKNLEDAGIKMSSVVSTLSTQSARAMLDALVAGERDPQVLAGLAKSSLVKKADALAEALRGRFREHHAFMVGLHLRRIDSITDDLAALNAQIDRVIGPFRFVRDALTTIPGISTRVADVIIAECGTDMSVFPTPGHLASWAGVCPGHNESAGRVKSAHTRPGNAYLKAALGISAMSVSRSEGTHLAAKYRRIKTRQGGLIALVAIEHTLLVICWHLITEGTVYTELGPGYAATRKPEQVKNNLVKRLTQLGYQVNLVPTSDTTLTMATS